MLPIQSDRISNVRLYYLIESDKILRKMYNCVDASIDTKKKITEIEQRYSYSKCFHNFEDDVYIIPHNLYTQYLEMIEDAINRQDTPKLLEMSKEIINNNTEFYNVDDVDWVINRLNNEQDFPRIEEDRYKYDKIITLLENIENYLRHI